MDLEHLENLRSSELSLVLNEINQEKKGELQILEIGAGSGWQAKKLSESGFSVEAIDVANSNYSQHRVWPIINYNGKDIPFEDEKFDVIFSSNVLEHIPELEVFQSEIMRVLKNDGIAIHVVPSGRWSFWTIIAHYPFFLKLVTRKIFSANTTGMERCNDNKEASSSYEDKTIISKEKFIPKIRNMMIAKRHGERGNVITEMYYFSKFWWVRFFESTGWKISKYRTNNLFYTGYSVFGSSLSVDSRKKLSVLLGASCHFFILRK